MINKISYEEAHRLIDKAYLKDLTLSEYLALETHNSVVNATVKSCIKLIENGLTVKAVEKLRGLVGDVRTEHDSFRK